MLEKAWSTPRVTIHRCLEICHHGMHFVHKWVRKRPYALCKSCRGILDLQLSYLHLGALQFNFLELRLVKQGYLKIFAGTGRSRTRRPRQRRAPPPPRSHWARTPRLGCHVESLVQRSTPPADPTHRRTAFPTLSPRTTRQARTGRVAPTLAAGLWRHRRIPCTAPPPCRAHTVDGRDFFPKARVPIKAQELAGRAQCADAQSCRSAMAVDVERLDPPFSQPPKHVGFFLGT
jgi:hypothetical protein